MTKTSEKLLIVQGGPEDGLLLSLAEVKQRLFDGSAELYQNRDGYLAIRFFRTSRIQPKPRPSFWSRLWRALKA